MVDFPPEKQSREKELAWEISCHGDPGPPAALLVTIKHMLWRKAPYSVQPLAKPARRAVNPKALTEPLLSRLPSGLGL